MGQGSYPVGKDFQKARFEHLHNQMRSNDTCTGTFAASISDLWVLNNSVPSIRSNGIQITNVIAQSVAEFGLAIL